MRSLSQSWQRRSQILVALGISGAAAVAFLIATVLGGGSERTAEGPRPHGPLSRIERRDLTTTTSASGTLGYRGRQVVLCRLGGTVTWLPKAGRIVRRGDTLVEVDERTVVLFYGQVPAYRTLAEGVSDGEDVRQLERNLAALGFDPYAAMTVDSEFTEATEDAIKLWQEAIDVKQTGEVELGEVIFLPGAQRVSSLETELGAAIGGGAGGSDAEAGTPGSSTGDDSAASSTTVLRTTSTRRGVSVQLDAADQGVARRGARVDVRLPNGSTTAGRVTHVSKVASQGGGATAGDTASGGKTTVAVTVELIHSGGKVDDYDEAPVSVTFTEVLRKDVLTVPVTAIVALPGGGYGVDALLDGRVRSVEVKTGAFADGHVEVDGSGVKPGMRVQDAA